MIRTAIYANDLKRCNACGNFHPADLFNRDSHASDGLRSECRPCESKRNQVRYRANRERLLENERVRRQADPDRHSKLRRSQKIKRVYGLTDAEFDVMKEKQDGCCLICGVRPVTLHIDHCHDSGQVRGLLCGLCNRGIGAFRDDPQLLDSAAEYLRR